MAPTYINFDKGSTVFGRPPSGAFPPPIHTQVTKIRHYTPPPGRTMGPIPGTGPARPMKPIAGTQRNTTGFDANKAALDRAKQQQDAFRKNQEDTNRRNAQITQNFLAQRQRDRQRQLDEANRQRLARQLKEQQDYRNARINKLHGLEYKFRNVKPWQWGVGAGAATFVAGIGFVEGVAAGAVVGLSRLSAAVAGALGTTASILNKIQNAGDREVMRKAIELGKGLTTFGDRMGALAKALVQVTNNPSNQVFYDKVIHAAYGIRNGYGIAEMENITYVVRVHGGKIIEVLGKFP